MDDIYYCLNINGTSLGGSGVIAGATFLGPVGTIIAGTCSALSSIAINGLSKVSCFVYGQKHKEKIEKKNMSSQDMKCIGDENNRELRGKITKLYVGWSKLCEEINHKISNLTIPLKFVSPFPFFSDKLFYHASIWVCPDRFM